MVQKTFEKYSDFFEEFEERFVEHFISLSHSYYQAFSKEELRSVAKSIYKEVLNIELDINETEEEVFRTMRQEGIMIGFLINRSMFYLLENFILFTSNEEKNSNQDIETLVLHISHFLRHFESHVCEKYAIQPMHLNFDGDSNIVFGNNILDIFKRIKEENRTVKFFNLYKGVPISNEAHIVDIDGEEIVFRTVSIQEIAMKMDDHAYILKDENFDKHIKADIVYNNFVNNTVVLSNFTYLLNMPASQREYIRVHPDISATVKMAQDGQNETKGKLFDLSINGLGVVSESNNGLYAGANIEIAFELKIGNELKHIDSQGEILNIIEYSDSYRYCIKIFPTQQEEEMIVQYVNLREKEIIQNLEDILKDYR